MRSTPLLVGALGVLIGCRSGGVQVRTTNDPVEYAKALEGVVSAIVAKFPQAAAQSMMTGSR